MSSVNEQLAPPPPKPRMSPLDFRNTDLVSRLLAATPPYLYNMSLLPNTYFFSEMLRSFVQAKSESAMSRPSSGSSGNLQSRRTRKRSWTSSSRSSQELMYSNGKSEISPKSDMVPQQPNHDWFSGTNTKNKMMDPSCLEMMTPPADNKLPHQDSDLSLRLSGINNNLESTDRKNLEPTDTSSMPGHMFPPSSHSHSNSQESPVSNLILPPPPPMWYPPLYPTAPYGIDPLHFFIDLRVSGHIYDRKNNQQKSETDLEAGVSNKNVEQTSTSPSSRDSFKPSRHASAFSVPVSNVHNKMAPINLSNSDDHESKTKFDVKSMLLDQKSTNKTGTTYIMSQLNGIYRNVNCDLQDQLDQDKRRIKNEEQNQTIVSEDNSERKSSEETESEEERQKKVKDLRALVGLELVLDYMTHRKPQPAQLNVVEESSSTDDESLNSPSVEVVDLQDNET